MTNQDASAGEAQGCVGVWFSWPHDPDDLCLSDCVLCDGGDMLCVSRWQRVCVWVHCLKMVWWDPAYHTAGLHASHIGRR
jgi:hypothetical protein